MKKLAAILGLGLAAAHPALAGPASQITPPTQVRCDPVQPVIWNVEVSAPDLGTGVCKTDRDCGSAQFCSYATTGSATGVCRSGGVLRRGEIYYLAGHQLHVTITAPLCTKIGPVLVGGVALGQGDSIEGGSVQGLSVYTTSATYNGQPALRHRAQLEIPNVGDGSSSPVSITLGALVGTATASYAFTVSRVAAINTPLRISTGRTELRNDYVVSIYQAFGDGDALWDTDPVTGERIERVGYGLDWDELGIVEGPFDLVAYGGSDIEIFEGQVFTRLGFTGDGPVCDGPASVFGSFDLVPQVFEGGIQGFALEWLSGPHPDVSADTICGILSFGIAELIYEAGAEYYDVEETLQERFRAQIAGSVGENPDAPGRIELPFGVRAIASHIGSGRIDLYIMPPSHTLRVNVDAARSPDATAGTNGDGIVFPPGFYVPLIPSGSYAACKNSNVPSVETCDKLALDASGVFNWQSASQIPVPDPWTSPSGNTAYYEPRHHAWQRLEGLVRIPSALPTSREPAGMLMVRQRDGATASPRMVAADQCTLAPRPGHVDRVGFGINDVQGSGNPTPRSGKLEVGFLLAQSADQSAVLYGNTSYCPAVPPPLTQTPAPGTGTVKQ